MSENLLKNHSVSDIEKAIAEGVEKLLGKKVKVQLDGLTFQDGDSLWYDAHMKASELTLSVTSVHEKGAQAC